MLFRIEAAEYRSRQECFEAIACLGLHHAERDIGGVGQRRVLLRPVNLRRHDDRFVLVVAAAGREEVELVTVAAGSVAAPRVAGVEPTTNGAARAPRHGATDRGLGGGTDREAGSRFVVGVHYYDSSSEPTPVVVRVYCSGTAVFESERVVLTPAGGPSSNPVWRVGVVTTGLDGTCTFERCGRAGALMDCIRPHDVW